MEQEEYTKEEIDWSYIEFIDNQDILDLLEKVCKFPTFKCSKCCFCLPSNVEIDWLLYDLCLF
jgi:hypothetical protein